ncbi:MAG: MGDG synthase family glycosyltransferase [Phycisphaerales bacterium]
MTGPRITICSAAVGCGHTRAALAIHDAIRRTRPDAAVTIVEALDHAPRWFVAAYRDAYLRLVRHAPSITGRMYDRSDRPGIHGGLGSRVEQLAMRRLASLDAVRRANSIVCTHFLCGRVLGRARRLGVFSAPLSICVTDQHPHAVWLTPDADTVLVASEAARHVAVQSGLAPKQVITVGIPVHPRFGRAGDPAALRRELGLPADRPIVLVTGGGLGLGGVEAAVRALLAAGSRLHVVAVCGRCQKLSTNLRNLAAGNTANLTVVGFTNKMPEYMAAASVLVGKPGGLTTAEAVASGLPMVLMNPIPGQEERNAQLLVAEGVAILERSAEAAAVAAARLIEQPARLAAMRASARRIAPNDAALTIARHTLELAESAVPASRPVRSQSAPAVLHGPIDPEPAIACLPCIAG